MDEVLGIILLLFVGFMISKAARVVGRKIGFVDKAKKLLKGF